MKKIFNKRYLEYFLLTAILLGGFAVRLYKINGPIADWHSWRQVDTAAVARIYLDEGVNLLYPKYYDISSIQTGYYNANGWRFVEFPIQSLFHVWGYKAFPQIGFDAWGRLTSIIPAVFTSYLLYLLGKKYINSVGGLSAAFFYSFLPFNIYFTRVILPEAMATMFAVAAVYFISVFIENEKKVYLYTGAASFCLSILVKPYAGFYAIPIIYLILRKFSIWKILTDIPLLLALDLALVPFFAWRAWIFPKVEGIPHFAWAFNGDGIRFRPAFWRWIFGERLGNLILGYWGLIPFGFGLLKKDKPTQAGKPTINLMLLGMFLYITVVATASVRHDYYQAITIPAIALVLAKGAAAMWNPEGLKKWSSRALLGFAVFMMVGMSAYQIKEFYKVNHPEFVEAGNAVDKLTPKDARVIAPNNGDTVFLYYTHRYGWPVLETSIDDAIKLGAKYYVSVNKNDADTSNFVKKFATLKEDKNYIILDLTKPIKTK